MHISIKTKKNNHPRFVFSPFFPFCLASRHRPSRFIYRSHFNHMQWTIFALQCTHCALYFKYNTISFCRGSFTVVSYINHDDHCIYCFVWEISVLPCADTCMLIENKIVHLLICLMWVNMCVFVRPFFILVVPCITWSLLFESYAFST